MNASFLLLIFYACAVAVAGYVRGYGGFGFSMITVAAVSLALLTLVRASAEASAA